jgi:hypothetical protein
MTIPYYTIHSATRITLSPEAKQWAAEHFGPGKEGLEEMARHLINQEKLREAGEVQKVGENS